MGPERGEVGEVEAELGRLVEGCGEVREALRGLGGLAKPSGPGLSLLHLKNHQLLDYVAEVALLGGVRASGRSLRGHPAVLRLCRLRTLLERLRPVQLRCQHQIEELLALLASDGPAGLRPAAHRPRPDNLASDEDADEPGDAQGDGDGEGEEAARAKKGLYVPPKVSAVRYVETGRVGAEEAEREAKRRRLSRSLVAELAAEFGDAPEEEGEERGLSRRRRVQQRAEQTAYEESAFIRLSNTSQAKARATPPDAALGFSDFAQAAEKREGRKGPKGSGKGKGKGKTSKTPKPTKGRKRKFRK